ncbi:T-cell-specific guanine nucleotide triphosphate-binding protein 2-like [Perognathus longimembris pacificus]|uniref:T-cell-specific guanine nucleotide triphosphate-binding protein 2-like n=1 Tax=Perognathus longimembris pacificus TaxID=214514 RepID=UPI0020199D45|nr:T-cell-specific guanine nucleotide triphosphate-binding protein 2-like [Perognathus longimembris pacificus]
MEEPIVRLMKDVAGKNFQKLAVELLPQYSALTSKSGGLLARETLSGIQGALHKGNVKDVVGMLQEALSAAENALLQVAVIGESGAGKSSLINALRGLGHEEEGSARVGVVETTMKKTPYQHPKYLNVIFWDLPGTGTLEFSPESYLETVQFSQYDFFLLVSSSRFTHNDAMLAQKITEMGKNFYFLRSKVDSDLYNEQRTKPKSFQKERVLQQIRDNCLENLSSLGVPDPCIFLISNFDLEDFDFPRLEETLLRDLPAHKRHTFVLLLPNFCKEYIDMKKEFLQGEIWLEALKSGVLALIPFMPFASGFDLPEQEKCLKLYRDYFGLDDKSLEEIAQKLGATVEALKRDTKSTDFWALVRDDSIGAKAMRCGEAICSVDGGVPSAVLQFLKNYFLRRKFLDTVAEDALLLMQKMK